ncbi:MAG: DEAD/DEAH box helicase, partial [Nannocystaceae bacterium]
MDRKFEKRLGNFSGGVIPEGLVPAVFDLLRGVRDLTLRGVPMSIGAPTCGLKVRVTDHKETVVARLEQEDDVREAFGNRVIRRGQTLHPLRDHGLVGPRFDELRRGRIFSARELTTLVSDIIPECRRAEIPISIETDRLPAVAEGVIRPALRLAAETTGEGIRIDATIEYGDPPVARVTRDRMILLGDEAVPKRAIKTEKSLLELLQRELGLDEGENLMNASDAIGLLERASVHPDVRVGTPGNERLMRVTSLVPAMEFDDGGDVRLSFRSASGERFNASAKAVVAAWERGEGYAPVLEGGFGEIPSDWMAEYGHLVADLLEARAVNGSEPPSRALAPELTRLCQALDHPPPPSFAGLAEILAQGTPPAFDYPEDLDATLRTYQEAGVDWLAFHRDAKLGALLADDMGLGKTLQALCVVRGKTLVVAPTSVLRNWQDEVQRFRPGLRVCRYHGSSRKLDASADIVLTSYALLRNDVGALAAIAWDLVILDEAQFIKNPASKVAQAAFQLNAEARIALTGTPVENRVEELWSQFHFLNRGLLGGRAAFKRRYERAVIAGDQAAVDRLR